MSNRYSKFRVSLIGTLWLALSGGNALAVKQVDVWQASKLVANGILAREDGQCLLVAPLSEDTSEKRTVNSAAGKAMPAQLLASLMDGVGLYRLERDDTFFCVSLWTDEQRIALLLESRRQPYLDGAQRSAEATAVELETTDSGLLEIKPLDESELADVLPGRLIRIRFAPVAMVIGSEVTEEGVVVTAARLDDLKRALLSANSELAARVKDVDTAPVIEPFAEARNMRVSARTKLRRVPDMESSPIKTLQEGTELEVTGKVKGQPWLAVNLFGLKGFLPEAAFSQ